MNRRKRLSFAKTEERPPLPNLIETQQSSYTDFLQRDIAPEVRDAIGLQAVFQEIFPILDYHNISRLEFVSYRLGQPKYALEDCVARGVNYQVSLTARLRLFVCEKDADSDEPHIVDIRESDVYFGDVPLMTETATFIINGSERVIVNQLHRSPGVIFLEKAMTSGQNTPTAQIIPYRGAWVEFESDAKDQVYVRLNKRRKMPATVLLRALGWETDADILQLFAQPEQAVLSGWRVTHITTAPCPYSPGQLLSKSEHKNAKNDYPGFTTDVLYKVVDVSAADTPVKPGDILTPRQQAAHGRKWKGTTFERIRQVTAVFHPDFPHATGDFIPNKDYRQLRNRYPGIQTESCYQVTTVDDDIPLKVGQILTPAERTKFRRKSKHWTSQPLHRVLAIINSGCPLKPGQLLTDTEYAHMNAQYPSSFSAEKLAQPGIQNRENLSVDGTKIDENSQIVGSVCAAPIKHPETGETLLTANTLLTETELERLRSAGIEAITVLNPQKAKQLRYLRNTLERDKAADYPPNRSRQETALLEIQSVLRPGDPPNVEQAHKQLQWHLFDPHRYDLGQVGRYKLNEKLSHIPIYGQPGENERTLRPEDIAATLHYLIDVQNEEAPKDDLDHLGNRRVRVIGELLENQFRIGLLQIRRATRERLNTVDMRTCVPTALINPKPLMIALREFFGSNQLSQFMQQINPLDELTHKRRISAIGPGGLQRDRATAAVRDVHHTHYGRVCPLETPEGPSIGLIASLACYARVNPYGFLETPYRKVVNGKPHPTIEYLTAGKEATMKIAAKIAPRGTKGNQITDIDEKDEKLPVRKGEDVFNLPLPEIDYIGIAPEQIVGVSAALVPFLEHEDANRALMGANHQRQAVPLLCPEAPLVGTGMEIHAARDSGALCIAKREGTVVSVSADDIIIRTGEALHADIGETQKSEMGYDVYKLHKFKRSNSGTCFHQHPVVSVGDRVSTGDILADGPSTHHGELALGRNILCAYMPWGGHNYEDSILISESLIRKDTFTSIHIEEFIVEARDTKMGPEEITRDIPDVKKQRLAQLDEEGIVRVGSVVGPGSILVGKITPKGESQYGPEEKLLHVIFGEKANREVRDTSTTIKTGLEGVVIDVKVFSRKMENIKKRTTVPSSVSPGDTVASAPVDVDELRYQSKLKQIEETFREQRLAVQRRKDEEIRRALLGCTLALPVFPGIDDIEIDEIDENFEEEHAPLGDTGDTVTEELLNTPGINPLEIYVTDSAAMAYIQRVSEVASERIAAYQADRERALNQLELGDELKPGVVKLVKVYVASKRPISVGDKMSGRYGNKGVVANILPVEDMPYLPDGTPVDIVLNPLGVPSRMNVGQILEIHLGWACHELGIYAESPVFDGATENEIFQLLHKTDLPERSKRTGKSILYDGRSGEPFAQEVTVGYVYFLKLNHLVADKMHARATGPYSLVTQQPLGGKAQHGGQRLGEMEVWALEAYGAAYTLQEMLTLKSDDLFGRAKMYEAIVKGLNPEPAGTPESFNVLVRELQGLGLNVVLNSSTEDDFSYISAQ